MKQIIITILLALAAVAAQAQEPFFCTDSAVVRGRIVAGDGHLHGRVEDSDCRDTGRWDV